MTFELLRPHINPLDRQLYRTVSQDLMAPSIEELPKEKEALPAFGRFRGLRVVICFGVDSP